MNICGSISKQQHDYLLNPIKSTRIATRKQGGKDLSYLESWDVRAHLIRIFGFGNFDLTTEQVHLCYQRDVKVGQQQNDGIDVAYLVTMKLVIRNEYGDTIATYSESAVGSAVGSVNYGDLHDNAVKQASSDALKRCAINLGTQFGLSLYDNGKREDVVRNVLVVPRMGADEDGPEESDTAQEAAGDDLTDAQAETLKSSLGATVVSDTKDDTPAEQVMADGSTVVAAEDAAKLDPAHGDEGPQGWYNAETGEWDKAKPDMPAFSNPIDTPAQASAVLDSTAEEKA